MRVQLKGVKKATSKGRVYYYAWDGGPRLKGAPGTPEFVASYNHAIASRVAPVDGTLKSLIVKFLGFGEFKKLKPRTQADYREQITKIEEKFHDFPLSALANLKTKGVFLAWRDELMAASPKQADYAWAVLRRILSLAKKRGLIGVNPCEGAGRVYKPNRQDKVWTTEHEQAFYEKAPAHLHLALLLALWTGQRRGDLLRLEWSHYDGTHLRFFQGKRDKPLKIPAGGPLKAALDAVNDRQGRILRKLDGTAWTEKGFKDVWLDACRKAGVPDGLTFHDLRGSAVTRLALAGCEVPEIATFTGLSLKTVHSILDAHYLSRDVRLAESAVRKLENSWKTQPTPSITN
jgi:integrase